MTVVLGLFVLACLLAQASHLGGGRPRRWLGDGMLLIWFAFCLSWQADLCAAIALGEGRESELTTMLTALTLLCLLAAAGSFAAACGLLPPLLSAKRRVRYHSRALVAALWERREAKRRDAAVDKAIAGIEASFDGD